MNCFSGAIYKHPDPPQCEFLISLPGLTAGHWALHPLFRRIIKRRSVAPRKTGLALLFKPWRFSTWCNIASKFIEPRALQMHAGKSSLSLFLSLISPSIYAHLGKARANWDQKLSLALRLRENPRSSILLPRSLNVPSSARTMRSCSRRRRLQEISIKISPGVLWMRRNMDIYIHIYVGAWARDK